MRILALVPGGIGDQILFFPTLRSLRQAYPQAQLDVVVEPRAVSAYEVCADHNLILPFAFKEAISLADLGDLLGRIRERQYTGVISLGRNAWLGFFLWLTGIPKRVGYAKFMTDRIALKADQYAAWMYHDLVGGFGLPNTPALPQLQVKQKDVDWATETKAKILGDRDYVVLHPGSSQLAIAKGINKIYPVAQWVDIIQAFQSKRPELALAIVAGPEDTTLAAEFRAAVPEVTILTPPRLGALAALIAKASLFLGTDSAPMHLAVATGTPVVALFGPTEPAKLLPPDNAFCRAITAADGQIANIKAADVIQAIFPV